MSDQEKENSDPSALNQEESTSTDCHSEHGHDESEVEFSLSEEQKHEMRMSEIEFQREKERNEWKMRERELALREHEMEQSADRIKRDHEFKIKELEQIRAIEELKIKQSQSEAKLDHDKNSGQNKDSQSLEKPTKTKVKVPKHDDEKDEIDVYLECFEKVAIMNNWNKKNWCLYLVPELTGKAKLAYRRLSKEHITDYDKLKQSILDAYELNAETYRRKFRSKEKGQDQSVKEWVTELQQISEKWIQQSGVKLDDGKAIRELIVMDQVLTKVPRDLRLYLKDKSSEINNQASKLAEFADKHIENMGGRKWYDNLAKKTHGTDRSEYKGTTSSGQSKSNPSSYNPAGRGKGATGGKLNSTAERRCYSCQELGHISSQCPKRREKSAYLTEVFVIDKLDKVVPGTVNGQNVKVKLDTACDQTVVDKKFVEPYQYQKKPVKLKGLIGRVTLPMARVWLDCEYFTGWVKAAVKSNSPKHVVLGMDVFEKAGLEVLITTRSKAKEEKREEKEAAESLNEVSLTSPDMKSEEKGSQSETVEETSDDPIWADFQPNELKKLQLEDITLAGIRDRVVPIDEIEQHRVCCYWQDGILYRKWSSTKSPHTVEKQIVVPEKYRSLLLKLAHDIPMSGHQGVERTKDRLLASFYWPGIFACVANYCKTCHVCQMVKSISQDKAPLCPLPIIDEPFKRVAIDIVGPLPLTKSRKRFVLVVCDYATRYPEAIPIPNAKAKTVARELWTLFSRVGIPQEILSDQGTHFLSALLKELCKLLGIRQLVAAPYHQQTNGLLERFNRTLKIMLRTVMQGKIEQWDEYLPHVLFAYRETPQKSTGRTPFELLYGRQVRGPLQVLKEEWTSPSSAGKTVVEYLLDMREKMETTTQLVRENMTHAQEVMKKQYDKKTKPVVFEKGQLVLLLLPTSANKLEKA
ncbi:uncharacterized protein [Amphiura filiformis]|uniref:uncharacterized protein n=1 Tax=Amphiura filiformis TaxID=82378 RepID=UPI003B225E76